MVLGVAQNPDPVPLVRCPECPSTHHDRPAGVACSFQRSKYAVRPSSSQIRNVLNEEPVGPDFADDPEHLPPQPAAFPGKSRPSACDGNVLAGEAAADEVDLWCECFNVFSGQPVNVWMYGNRWPVPGEHAAAIRVDFAEKHGLKSAAPKPQSEAADAAEQINYRQSHNQNSTASASLGQCLGQFCPGLELRIALCWCAFPQIPKIRLPT